MGTVIGEQVRTLAASVLLGMALALLYDLLRALRLRRRKSRRFTDALDGVYCLALVLSGAVFALRIGNGELRLYTLAAAAAGAAVFFGALSPLLRPLWDFWARVLFELLRLLRLPLRALQNFQRNLHKTAKRLFLFCRRSFIIGSYRNYALRARRRAERREGVRYGGTERKPEKTRKPAGGGARPRAAGSGGVAVDAHARPARRGARGADGARRTRRAPGAGEPLPRSRA
ncbi:MAG: hypothetical protein IJV43_05555 [Oscillospiraceae bacterium]|nr:hypothetical protein [Oscillospiraceae bacterium]